MTVVVAALIVRAGRILVAQRSREGAHPLKWEFPGGKAMAGELPETALERELLEELSIAARPAEKFLEYQFSYPGKPPITLIFYWVRHFDGILENRIFEQLTWARTEELRTFDFLEGDAPVVKTLEASGLREA